MKQMAEPEADPWSFTVKRQDLAELSGLTVETTVRVSEKEAEAILGVIAPFLREKGICLATDLSAFFFCLICDVTGC